MKNETIIFDAVAPHSEPVNIASLLSDIEAIIKRHVILNDHAATALAVWVLHTYAFELRDTVAYVAIESPEKRCGKTTLLSVLAAMACKSLIASNVTLSALFRAIDTCSPTLFIDEADTFLAGNGAMRGIINSGNTRRTAYVLRLSARHTHRSAMPPILNHPIEQPKGFGVRQSSGAFESGCATESGRGLPQSKTQAICEKVHDSDAPPIQAVEIPQVPMETGLKKYSCWCPKVIAMIGQVPDTIADRSIIVQMSRKLVSETCAPLAELNTTEIRAKCVRFALDAGPAIAQSPKFRAHGLNDRAADTFDPLFAIARLAGKEWHQKLHTAALALASTADTENSGSGLILDIIDVIFDTQREKIFSSDLVTSLREGGLKSSALKYSAINEHQIAKILRPYGIKPLLLRVGSRVQRGYTNAQFREALTRYVPRADIEARFEQMEHRAQLQAEAEKEKALMQQAFAEASKSGTVSFPAAFEVLQKLRNNSEISNQKTS